MSIKVNNALVLIFLVLLVGAYYEAEAYGNCLDICREACQKMKPDPKVCAHGCYNICEVDEPRTFERRLLMKVDKRKFK